MTKKAVHICGTGSGVGKSVIVTALCRIFQQEGYSVCPFKAQNMALNSFVTKTGGEIGRAQAVQAYAAGLEPSVDMNPVLIKPTTDVGAQIIVRGKPFANMAAFEYIRYKKNLADIVLKSFNNLRKKYEIVVMEGAGSPAEINLKRHDIVNMKMAERVNAPVILVGDIDKGGVFAWIVGTLELLTARERKRVKGIIINKFRGDKKLLEPGIAFLEKRTGIKVLGVIPFFKDIKIPEEDSVALENRTRERGRENKKSKLIKIAVICLPHISNFTDFDPLEREKDVVVKYVRYPEELQDEDVIILPGTKNTIADMGWLKIKGFALKITRMINLSKKPVVIGICGGFQMLGRKILDPSCVESDSGQTEGLGFLDMITTLERKKTTTQVKAKELFFKRIIIGYEIHHGITKKADYLKPMFRIVERKGRKVNIYDGAKTVQGDVWGTYLHGVFDNDWFRKSFLDRIREKKNLPRDVKIEKFDQDKEFDKLARLVKENLNMECLGKMLGLKEAL